MSALGRAIEGSPSSSLSLSIFFPERVISARKDGCFLVNRGEHRHYQSLSYNVSSAGIDRRRTLRYFDLSLFPNEEGALKGKGSNPVFSLLES